MTQDDEGGMIDLLEIYHARKIQQHIVLQLRRLRNDSQLLPLEDIARKRAVVQYYEAMLITVDELLHQIGDRVLVG